MVHESDNVFHQFRTIRFLLGRLVGTTVAGHIQRDHSVVLGKQIGCAGQIPIEPAARQPAVNEYDWLTLASVGIGES